MIRVSGVRFIVFGCSLIRCANVWGARLSMSSGIMKSRMYASARTFAALRSAMDARVESPHATAGCSLEIAAMVIIRCMMELSTCILSILRKVSIASFCEITGEILSNSGSYF